MNFGTSPRIDGDAENSLFQEIERLREENLALRKKQNYLSDYIRNKTNQLLRVMGTASLQPEELDDDTLLEVDPIGIVSESFLQVIEHLHETNADLEAARQNLQAIFDSAGAGIMVVDSAMRIVSFNRKMREWFKLEDEDLGTTCQKMICRSEKRRAGCTFHAVMTSGHGESYSDMVVGDRHFQAMATPIKDDRGSIDRVIMVYADITDRQRMEETLREAQIRMHSIFESVQAGILLVDCETREITHANPAAQAMTGYRLEEMVGKRCQGFICPREIGECPVIDLGGRIERAEVSILTSDNRTLPILKTIVPLTLDGRPHLLETFVDITEIKGMEESLRIALAEVQAGRERIDTVVRSIGDGVMVTDTDGKILLMNPAAEDFFQKSLIGMNIHDIAPVIGDERLYQKLVSALTSTEMVDFHRPSAQLHESRIFQGRSSIIRDLNGEDKGHVLALRDLTRDREVERLKREFVSNAGHELQTPLTAIIGFSELLLSQEDLPAETRRECLKFIHEKGEDLSGIVDNLLDINRIASGRKLELRPERCNLRQLLMETIEPFKAKMLKHSFRLSLPPEPLEYQLDARKVKKVIESLLSNAVKYSPGGGVVEVGCQRLAEGFELTVADEGEGMEKNEIHRMFEVFSRGNSSNTSAGGTGLGLAIVKQMVEAHGGHIRVESHPGQGSCFFLYFPLTEEIAE